VSGPSGHKLPDWTRPGRDISHVKDKQGYERSMRYYRQIHQATPPWLPEVDRARIRAIYKECKRRRARGENVVVDHIVPLMSDVVCGLQVPWNMQIISYAANSKKSNIYWPDNPHETIDFAGEFEPYQMRLF